MSAIARLALATFVATAIAAAPAARIASAASEPERAIPASALRSGITFAGADVRAMQADDLSNPGFLWVERGESLWRAPAGDTRRSCESCHGDAKASMRGVAARYPAVDAASGQLMSLDERIEDCRVRRQRAEPWPPESEPRLSLDAYVAFQSRGMPVAVSIAGAAREPFERARAFYLERHGQMNLSCAQCHERHWGRRLYTETVSQGHGTAFPAYRLEWQAMGSLQRRIRACLFGIRAQMPPPGAPELTEMELYLAWRAAGLALESPGVRR